MPDKVDYLERAKRWAHEEPVACAVIALVERMDALLERMDAKPMGSIALMGACKDCVHLKIGGDEGAVCANPKITVQPVIYPSDEMLDFGCVLWEPRED